MKMMKKLGLALVVGLAVVLGACQTSTRNNDPFWGEVAMGVGATVGPTKADPQIQKAVDTIYQYCGALRTVAALGTVFAPEKQRKAAEIASAAISGVCDSPPTGNLNAVQAALTTAVKAYEAAIAVQRTAPAGGV
jgi:hypothetical protein